MKEASQKGYILYDSNYMTFWERQNYRESKKICGCQKFVGGKREEGLMAEAQVFFKGGESILYDTVFMDT